MQQLWLPLLKTPIIMKKMELVKWYRHRSKPNRLQCLSLSLTMTRCLGRLCAWQPLVRLVLAIKTWARWPSAWFQVGQARLVWHNMNIIRYLSLNLDLRKKLAVSQINQLYPSKQSQCQRWLELKNQTRWTISLHCKKLLYLPSAVQILASQATKMRMSAIKQALSRIKWLRMRSFLI